LDYFVTADVKTTITATKTASDELVEQDVLEPLAATKLSDWSMEQSKFVGKPLFLFVLQSHLR